jgi:hypothetical protein
MRFRLLLAVGMMLGPVLGGQLSAQKSSAQEPAATRVSIGAAAADESADARATLAALSAAVRMPKSLPALNRAASPLAQSASPLAMISDAPTAAAPATRGESDWATQRSGAEPLATRLVSHQEITAEPTALIAQPTTSQLASLQPAEQQFLPAASRKPADVGGMEEDFKIETQQVRIGVPARAIAPQPVVSEVIVSQPVAAKAIASQPVAAPTFNTQTLIAPTVTGHDSANPLRRSVSSTLSTRSITNPLRAGEANR